MCGSKPKTPKVVQRDPQQDAAKAAAEAAKKANEETAATRARKQQSSLMARGAAGVQGDASTLMQQAGAKLKLGG